MCTLAPESTTNSLSYGSSVDAAGSTHSSAGKWNAALYFSLSLWMFLARFQDLLRAHRYCRSVSSWDLSSSFHSVGTSLMRNFDIYFSQRWSFLFQDTRMTQRRLCESYLWIGSKTFCIGLPRDFLTWETSASESCDTQPNCDTLFTIATAFLSSLSLLFGKWPFFGFLFCRSSTL